MTRRLRLFVGVGAIGFLVQLGSLALMTTVAGWSYQLATALAVELAVLHNFLWHERLTWRDRVASRKGALGRFARFQVTTGASSVLGNVLCTALLVEQAGFPILAANLAAVVIMSAVNYLLSDRWVFARRPIVAAVAAVLLASTASAAELRPETWRHGTNMCRTWRPTSIDPPRPLAMSLEEATTSGSTSSPFR